MPSISNIHSLRRKLLQLADRYSKPGETPAIVVGYAANYAIYVHERPAKHLPGKQWKFLEQPAREMGGVMTGIVSESLSRGADLRRALYLAGLRLQRESQQIVPIDTGNLRASAFTADERELEAVFAEAAAKGESVGAETKLKQATQKNRAKIKKYKQRAASRIKALRGAIRERFKQQKLQKDWAQNKVFHANLKRANRGRKRK